MNGDGGMFFLLLGLFFVYIVFPIWAASFAAKRGNDSAPVVILLTSFVGLGPLVALLYFLGALGKPLESDLIDQYQRQCPICGGYKVDGRRANTRTKLYYYHCQLCGYNWQWDFAQGKSWPSVQADTALIAKGEQKLQEEERKRQQQQRDAEALYYLTHQKK